MHTIAHHLTNGTENLGIKCHLPKYSVSKELSLMCIQLALTGSKGSLKEEEGGDDHCIYVLPNIFFKSRNNRNIHSSIRFTGHTCTLDVLDRAGPLPIL